MERTHKRYSSEDREKAFEVFKSTGEIQDALLVFFDQHGKWVGYMYSGMISKYNASLSKQRIPKKRLIKTCEDGRKILLSSFRSGSSKRIELDYHHVIGSLEARRTREFRAPNLAIVDGGMWIESARVIHLPVLDEVNMQLTAESLTIVDLPNLKTVDGSLVFNGAHVINTPKLETVNYEVQARSAYTFFTPRLRWASQLSLNSARILHVPNLKAVGRIDAKCVTYFDAPELEVVYNDICVIKAIDIHAPRLQEVQHSLVVSSAINFHAPSLKSVQSELDAGSATNFDALKLETVGRLILPPETLHAAVRAGCKAAIAIFAEGM
ncbi:MAG: hypothetical protein Q8Q59_01850 [Luteolibacter sp.]|jgi:hypothetical protein|nr:hypothetical protein [Luteolibacter sp.]